MRNSKYLVLGSSGLIGQSLCKYLRLKGGMVYEFDIKNDEKEDLRIKDGSELINLIQDSDFVFFLAFDVGGAKFLNISNQNFEFLHNNTQIISNTFEVLKMHKKKFLFVSSYLANNLSHSYGLLKYLGEHYTHSINGLIVRLYNVYGNEDISNRSHVIPDLIFQGLNLGQIKLGTNGKERRQFLYVDDCSEGLFEISENYDAILKETNPIDLTSFDWISIADIATLISKKLNCDLQYSHIVATHIDEHEPESSVLKYWNPTTSIELGLDNVIRKIRGIK